MAKSYWYHTRSNTFVVLIGTLGLCPYTVDDSIASAVERIHDKLGHEAARDSCGISTKDNVIVNAEKIERATDNGFSQVNMTLTPLENISFPKDTLAGPSWKCGVQAAKNVRAALSISSNDNQ